MITISEPVDKRTANLLKGLRTLINANDANSVDPLSYPGTVEVKIVNRLNIQEQIYLEYLGWEQLEDNKTWRFKLNS